MKTVRISENRMVDLLLAIFRDTVTLDVWESIAAGSTYRPLQQSHSRSRRGNEELAHAHYLKGLTGLAREDMPSASKDLELAADLYEGLDDHPRQAAALMATAIAHWRQASGKSGSGSPRHGFTYGEAFALCRQSELLCREREWAVGLAAALEVRGEFHRRIGDFGSALDAYAECLKVREAAGDLRGAAEAVMAFGAVHEALGHHDESRTRLADALARFHAAGDRLGEVGALGHLAAVHCSRGELDEALKHALRALAIYEVLGERIKAADMMMTIARIHEKENDLDVAIGFNMKAIAMLDLNINVRAAHDPALKGAETETPRAQRLRVQALLNIGRLQTRTDQPTEARFYLENALMIAQTIGDPQLQYRLHKELSWTWARLNDFQKALEHHQHFARIRKEVASEEQQREIAIQQIRFDLDQAERDRTKMEEMKREMRHQEDKLALMAAELLKKSEFLKMLRTLVLQIQRRGAHNGDTMTDEILTAIDQSDMADQTRVLFENQRDVLHRDFITRLSALHPKLTPKQLIVCSTIRLNLDLTAEGIGDLLCISHRTVEKHKENIRENIALDSDTDLGTYLTSI